ncbi:MAG: hypothetical protein WKF95_13150 [Rubrobacter sp.]
MRKIAATTLMLAAILAAGCSEQEAPSGQQNEAQRQSDAPKQSKIESQKSKTVVVNEGMSKEEEDKLNERIAALEDEANEESTEEPTQESESAEPTQETEDAARAAAQDYYAAAAGGNYSYTYSNLTAVSQGQFTEDEWVADNTTLGSDAGNYSVNSVEMVDDSTAEVQLTITSADGSSSERFTRFVLENGSWKHDLTSEEYELFADATADSTSATASATASADANEPEPESAPVQGSGGITLSGSGPEATRPFQLEEGLTVIGMSHQGDANFIVDILDENGNSVAPMGVANVIGPFEGSTPVQIARSGQYLLDVQNAGQWQIQVEQPRADSAPGTTSFSGNSAQATQLFELSGGLHRVELTHQGDANFIVDLLDDNGASVVPMGLVNEIGPFDGSRAMTVPGDGTYLFSVQANGPWTITVD